MFPRTLALALIFSAPILVASGACDDGQPPRDACGRTHQECRFNEATGHFDRDCKFVAPPDGGPTSCDGGAGDAAGGAG